MRAPRVTPGGGAAVGAVGAVGGGAGAGSDAEVVTPHHPAVMRPQNYRGGTLITSAHIKNHSSHLAVSVVCLRGLPLSRSPCRRPCPDARASTPVPRRPCRYPHRHSRRRMRRRSLRRCSKRRRGADACAPTPVPRRPCRHCRRRMRRRSCVPTMLQTPALRQRPRSDADADARAPTPVPTPAPKRPRARPRYRATRVRPTLMARTRWPTHPTTPCAADSVLLSRWSTSHPTSTLRYATHLYDGITACLRSDWLY